MEIKTKMTHEMLPEKFARLRRQAEERVKQWPVLAPHAHLDLHKVVHELKIHLAELEIQNEELKQAMKEMAEQHDKDEKMYDFGQTKEMPVQFKRDNRRGRPHREAAFHQATESDKW
ncbi:MAG: hypothetical protein V2B19_05340 [Pseudomonadota bacterium]